MNTIQSSIRNALIVFSLIGTANADLVLETETAELGKKGDWLFSQAIQVDHEKDGGRSIFTVNQYEYALTSKAEILIEPFFYEWNNPKSGRTVDGVGDLEITPSYMVMIDDEKSWLPAALLAFKLKVPTALIQKSDPVSSITNPISFWARTSALGFAISILATIL